MTDDVLTADASLSLADSYYVDGNYALAINAYEAASILARDPGVRFRSLSHKSGALMQLGRYDEACSDAKAALEFSSSGGLRKGETEACYNRVGKSLFHLGIYEEALTALEKASQLAILNNGNGKNYESIIQQCKDKIGTPTTSAADPPVSSSSAPAVAASVAKPRLPVMPKYQYYQNDTFMKIEILEHSVKEADIRVDFSPRKLSVILKKQGVEFTVVHGILFEKVDVSRCKVVLKDEKVLIKLRKTEPQDWHELFGKNTDEEEETQIQDPIEIPTTTSKVRPYSSTRDWDAIERNLDKQEQTEKPEGDEAMNALFQKIYSNASEETRRAMIKSYQTSGGTVLSTNWDEVKEKDYEGKDRVAAKGQEWKDWEGRKLPQKDWRRVGYIIEE